ncbi:hypothetical protein CF15_00250 [Pyrodictium occultum]|uniref:Peptidase M24 n=1 Tax=Pyrodictium occultum TaxID=2309 RepID=A0A0V8RTE0_PYROC|nr:Xaa-Pro peptidase family protein [Pyrodictium occultum]KSW11339.1 hypothetical protein CF15_00250 [Pyrodictium occultum]
MRHSLLKKLASLVEEKGGCGAVVSSEANVFYFTGFRGPGHLVYDRDSGSYTLLVPALEYLRAKHALEEEGLLGRIELAAFAPYGLPGGLELDSQGDYKLVYGRLGDIIVSMLPKGCRLLVDTDSLALYKRLASTYNVEEAGDVIADMRAVKEPWEIERMEEAAAIAEAALNTALYSIDAGVSEADIAAMIEYEMRRRGASDHSFPPIVAFGENTVYPHAEPSPRRVMGYEPQPVLIDLGAVYKGYCSDMTRTAMEGAREEFRRVAEAVHEATYTAIDAIEPGVTSHEVYEAARRVLASHGLDKYFIHSLGHGVGIEIHEKPRVSYKSETKLREGMVVTVEPGVYIPGKFGVRIEEMVLVTQRGARLLTRYPSVLW